LSLEIFTVIKMLHSIPEIKTREKITSCVFYNQKRGSINLNERFKFCKNLQKTNNRKDSRASERYGEDFHKRQHARVQAARNGQEIVHDKSQL